MARAAVWTLRPLTPGAGIPAADDQTPQGPQATDLFPGLPALPSGESDQPGAHKVSALTDNIQLGFEYIGRSLTGATVNVDALELVSGGSVDTAFGFWQWSGFTGGLKPLDLTVDFNLPAGDEFWLLLSNYSTGLWEIRGPQTGATTTFNFTPGTGYISPNGNSYVAIIACGGNQITVNQLNVTADADIDGPCKPVNLHTTNVTKFQIALAWEDGCTVPDFQGYNTYMVTGGPDVDFYKDDPGVEKLNTNPRLNPVFTKTGLTPGTTYHFRVEAVDDAGNFSPLSDRLDVTTVSDPAPGAPTNLHTTAIGGTSATLAWDAPADADITNYKIYQDGVLVLTVGAIPTNEQVTGLDLLTEYDFEVSAVDGAAQEGPKSNICTFTTVSNQPPVADFTISPDYIGVSEDVAFNPYLSSDDTTPLNQCSASWDFDNDGTFEIVDQLPGNQVVTFQYATSGSQTVKLVLKDASGDPGEITHDLVVNRQLNSFDLGIANGYPGTVLAVDTDALSSDIAALVDTSGALYLYRYNGSWNTIDATNEIGSDTVLDIACGNGKIGVLTANLNNNTKLITWTVHEYNGSWSTPDSGTQSNSIAMLSGRLAFARTSGRCSVALNCAEDPGGPSPNVWDLRVWHERSSGGYNAVLFNNALTAAATMDLVRDDTNTTMVYTSVAAGTSIKSASIQDAGSSSVNQPAIGSAASYIHAQSNPADSTQVFWTIAYGSNIAWGDNYGSANGGGQTFATGHSAVTGLLGMKYAADNQCEFYWVDLDSNNNDFLRRYLTVSSTLSELANGYGIADGGGGGFYNNGSDDGVYFVVTEDRDGGARGYNYEGIAQVLKEPVHNLINQDSYDPKSFPVVFPDDSLVCLYDKLYPNCMRADAPALNQSFTQSQIGDDAWLSPVAVCLTSDADLMMTANYTDDSALLMNTLAKSDSSIVQTLLSLAPVRPHSRTTRPAAGPCWSI